MKKFVLILLCVLMIGVGVSCDTTEENIPNNIDEKSTGDVDQPTNKESVVFGDYDDILQRYQELIELSGNNKTNITKEEDGLKENDLAIENALYTVVVNASGGSMGYSCFDVNNDGINELLLIDEYYNIYAAFSKTNGTPKLLDTFFINNHFVSLDQNGTFYKTGYGKDESSYTRIMAVANDGNFEIILEYGCDGETGEYYAIENSVKRTVELQDILIFQERYGAFLQDPTKVNKESGMAFVPIV